MQGKSRLRRGVEELYSWPARAFPLHCTAQRATVVAMEREGRRRHVVAAVFGPRCFDVRCPHALSRLGQSARPRPDQASAAASSRRVLSITPHPLLCCAPPWSNASCATTQVANHTTASPSHCPLYCCTTPLPPPVAHPTNHELQAHPASSRGLPLLCQCFAYTYAALP